MKKADLKKKKNLLPPRPGIYMFKNERGDVLYVGKANNLKHRLYSYFGRGLKLGERTKLMLSQARSIDYITVDNGIEALLLEANLIKELRPVYNVRWVDGKAYPFIRITIKEKYPKVLEARRAEDKKSLYFGPYVTIGAMRQVLRLVRGIFPFQAAVNHPKKPCLFYHLGLCPCPYVFDNSNLERVYRKNIKYLITFFEGKKKDLLDNLFRDMERLAVIQQFEEAGKIKQQIAQIELITSPRRQPIDYLENPDLLSDVRMKELENLREVLSKHGLKVDSLSRIECFDISNITGRLATGSMAVFINGEKESSLYRHFRIKTKAVPNDVAMMREILTRRLTHPEWPYPGLLIVDGGKGQVSGALSVSKEKNIQIPVIGLAKRLEEIVIPRLHLEGVVSKNKFNIVRLPLSSPALNFMRRIRDEAHRFAIQYHRKLRLKTVSS